MDAARSARQDEKDQLLKRLAEIMVEEQKEEGVFVTTPHYSIIELAAMKLGRQLSCQAQERAMREVAAGGKGREPCPKCGRECPVETKRRTVDSIDGPVKVSETVANCRKCRRSFFPSTYRPGDG